MFLRTTVRVTGAEGESFDVHQAHPDGEPGGSEGLVDCIKQAVKRSPGDKYALDVASSVHQILADFTDTVDVHDITPADHHYHLNLSTQVPELTIRQGGEKGRILFCDTLQVAIKEYASGVKEAVAPAPQSLELGEMPWRRTLRRRNGRVFLGEQQYWRDQTGKRRTRTRSLGRIDARTLVPVQASLKRRRRAKRAEEAEAVASAHHKAVTAQILKLMEEAEGHWEMPWYKGSLGMPKNFKSSRSYSGINILTLWASASEAGYTSAKWGTRKQWENGGSQINPDQLATQISFFKPITVDAKPGDPRADENGQITFFMAKPHFVYNRDQVEGLAPEPQPKMPNLAKIDAKCEAFFADLGADIRFGGTRAYYSPAGDYIKMPPREAFIDTTHSDATTNYYCTLAHEAGHYTGAPHRLNRDMSGRFGSVKYSGEEMVAELVACFLACELGLTPTPREDHALYLKSWIKKLQNDPKAIFKAAAQASKAVAWIKRQVKDNRQAAGREGSAAVAAVQEGKPPQQLT